MKKIIFFLLITVFVSHGYVDIGVYGREYNIEEKNIRKDLYDRLKKLDTNKIKNDFALSLNNAFIFKSSLIVSKIDKTFDNRDEVIVPFDVPNPLVFGTLKYKAGDKIYPNIGNKLAFLCFVDGGDELLLKETIREFGKCDYMIANRDIRTIPYLTNNYNTFPMTKAYIDRFKVKAFPVRVILYQDRIAHQYLSVPRMIEKIKHKGIKK